MDFNGRSGEMVVFATVAEEGSLSAAARALGLTPSAVSRIIARTEQRLGTRLLLRTTRAITFTAEGEAYLRGARRILADMAEVEEAITDQGVPRGRLRVSAALGHGRLAIVPLVAAFSARYPNITVDLSLGDEVVDILGGQADVAVRFGHLPDSPLTARKVGETGQVVVASPDYLQRHGTPVELADLARHRCLGFTPWLTQSSLAEEFPLEHLHLWDSQFISNHGSALKVAALNHAGIVLQPRALLSQELASGALLEILPDALPAPRPVNLLYPAREPMPLRLRLLIDYLSDHRHELDLPA